MYSIQYTKLKDLIPFRLPRQTIISATTSASCSLTIPACRSNQQVQLLQYIEYRSCTRPDQNGRLCTFWCIQTEICRYTAQTITKLKVNQAYNFQIKVAFFHETNPPGSLINGLKGFRVWLKDSFSRRYSRNK